MTFTEMVVEAGDARSPLLRTTRQARDAFAVVRLLDDGQLSRRLRVAIFGHGPATAFESLPRDLRAARPQDEVEVAFQGPDEMGLILHAPVDGASPMGILGLAGAMRELGLDAFVDPVLVRDGRARIRALVPRHLEPAEALRALQDAQRSQGLTEFRVLRVGPVQPPDHVAVVRRMLPPEQEDLLRLAASMGYYDTPKRSTLDTIAQRVGLSISPVHKRLKAAEETLVGQHVQPATPAAAGRRRVRFDRPHVDATQPWEVTVRVHAPDWGPSAFAAAFPGAQVLLQTLSEDRATGASRQLLTALVPEDLQGKLLSTLEGRPEISHVHVLARERGFLSARIEPRGRAGYGLSWWSEVWGGDAVLRPVLFEGDEALIRILLVRPQTEERFQARLGESAKAGHWLEHEVVHARPLGRVAAPPEIHEPLTTRQLEVLRVAHALGYYQTPRGCTLEGVARTLGVSANAIHKNLVLAESKIISAYLGASF